MKRIIIAGGRDFSDYNLIEQTLLNYFNKYHIEKPLVEIVSGGAKGADRLGERFAKQYDIPVKLFPANWDLYGKSAGYRRNKEMAEYADCLIAFWDGKSKGTGHMIDLANKNQLIVNVINY